MRLSVGELCELAGVSARTLHYYDEIGLLTPGETTEAGYRFYGEPELMRLQQILFYRELDFPLSDIKRILSSPDYDRRQAMRENRELLVRKRRRLDRLIRLTDESLKGGTDMGFDKFDNTEVEQAQQQYAAEAEERWGKTEAYAESKKRTGGYGKQDWAVIQAEMDDLVRSFAACLDLSAADERAQALVKQWQEHITKRYYPCTDAILQGLGQMYVADERFTQNLDRFADGTAKFISDAIAVYTAKK